MGRAPCCDKANVKKGPWSPEEDDKLKSYIEKHGTGGNWIALPQKIGLKRCGKSCRLRWLNYLRPNIKHGGFSEEEDNIICSLYISIGSRWSIIAAQLPGRTDNDIKNYWNTRLKKKLLGKQRKEKQARSTAKGKQKPSPNISDSLMIEQVPVGYYEPQLPTAVQPIIPYSNEEPRLINDHASIRKLLIKFGGRFSNGDQNIDGGHQKVLEYPAPIIDNESLLKIQPDVYNVSSNINDLVSNSYHQIPLVNATSGDPSSEQHFEYMMNNMLHGSNAVEGVVYENPGKLQGLEFFYDDDIINNVASSETSTFMNWGEMSPLVFEGFLHGSTQEGKFAIDKTSYRGTSDE